MSEPVKWGVLGVAKIATEKVIPAMQQGALCRIEAIASRDGATARGRARRRINWESPAPTVPMRNCSPTPRSKRSIIRCPNELHVAWTEKALAAGKHVLCEKPIALDAEQARRLIAARDKSGKRVAEAFMVRHHPQWRRAREIVRSGAIGEVGAIQTLFAYRLLDPENVRNRPPGGGGLYDVGCYAIVSARYIFGDEPTRVAASIDFDPKFGTDRLASAILEFPGGRHLTFTVATQLAGAQRVTIAGTAGRIEVKIPFNAPPDRPTEIVIDSAADLVGGGARVESFPTCDQYTLQGDAFARAVRGEGALEFSLEDAIANMRVIDACFRAGKSGRWEAV